MAKKESKETLERTYNIPLRREFLKVPSWRRTEKAITAVKEFLVHHMKSDNVKIGTSINKKIWEHGIRNPPHHVKVTVKKNDKEEVTAELFDYAPKKKEAKKSVVKKTVTKTAPATPVFEEQQLQQ